MPDNFKIFSEDFKNLKLIQNAQNAQNEIKKKFIFSNSEDYLLEEKKSLLLNFKEEKSDLGEIKDGIITIKRKETNYIVSFQITYEWYKPNSISIFIFSVSVNDKVYNFTIGWDSFPNKLNILYKQISLNLSKNDIIKFEIINKNIPLMILNSIIIIEEY